MKSGERLWTREELFIIINLYSKLSFGQLHQRNLDVRTTAQLINRTHGSVAYKLVNMASLDPKITATDRRGAANVSKLDREVWLEFMNNWDVCFAESERLLAIKTGLLLPELLVQKENEPVIGQGKIRIQSVAVRTNQGAFRSLVMLAYNNTCCITGINEPNLLIASHIKPWSVDDRNRLNPRNGLALNGLHDKAFDAGLITVTTTYEVKVSSKLLRHATVWSTDYFAKYHNQPILLPKKFEPAEEFLVYHNHYIFIP